MSSTTNEQTNQRVAAPTRITTFLFAATVVFFLVAGLAIVAGQIATLVAGDASAARDWAEAVGPYAFGGASVSGLLSFVLSYRDHDHD